MESGKDLSTPPDVTEEDTKAAAAKTDGDEHDEKNENEAAKVWFVQQLLSFSLKKIMSVKMYNFSSS